MGRFQRRSRLAITMPLLLAAVTPPAMAQDLPAINYSVTDGLPSDEVIRVVHDPAGFLWVGTSNALARFDGKAFKTYGRNEGIDVGTGVNDIRVAANGDLWIATNGNGIFHFNLNSWNPTADVRRMTVGTGRASNRVNSFALTFDGELWAATDAGIFVGSQEADQLTRVDLPLPAGLAQDSVQATSVVLRESEVWISTNAGIHRCRSKPQRICSRVLSDIVMVMLIDSDNQLWTGGDSGVSAWRLKDGNPAGQPQKFGGGNILRMFLSSDGSVLAGTRDGRALIVHDNRADLLFDTATQTPVIPHAMSGSAPVADSSAYGGKESRCTRPGTVYANRTCAACFAIVTVESMC